jgi:nucleoside-diphosphate-sugar epimerase
MVLVTGGTGLLGTHLILALHAMGIKPKALFRSNIPETVKEKAFWISGDILDVV